MSAIASGAFETVTAPPEPKSDADSLNQDKATEPEAGLK